MADSELLLQIGQDVAVLLKGQVRVEKQLDKQNGIQRESSEMLAHHDAQLKSLVGYIQENREGVADNRKEITAVKLSTAKLTGLIGGGTTVGAAIGYGLEWLVRLATGG